MLCEIERKNFRHRLINRISFELPFDFPFVIIRRLGAKCNFSFEPQPRETRIWKLRSLICIEEAEGKAEFIYTSYENSTQWIRSLADNKNTKDKSMVYEFILRLQISYAENRKCTRAVHSRCIRL